MKKLLVLIIIGFAIFATMPAQADHRSSNSYGYNSYPGYGGNFHRGYNFNRWHDPYGYHNHRYGHRHDRWRNRQFNRDIAGVIIGGIILGQIFNNNNQRQYNNYAPQQCYDVRRNGYDQYGNSVEYYERVCN